MKIKQIKILSSLLLIGSVGSLWSCRDDLSYNGGEDLFEDGSIRIGASVAAAQATRDGDAESFYIESGTVDKGLFTITYPYYYQTINTGLNTWRHLYDYGEVTFGYEGMKETGIAVKIKNNDSEPLRWADTGSSANQGIYVRSGVSYDGDSATLYMDNVSRTDFVALQSGGTVHQRDSLISINTNPEKNPYKASVFDTVNGTNDLLWGKARAKKYDRYINFKLHHNMSRLIVKVVVEDGADESKLKLSLDRANVRIENILTEPLTYNRLTGDLLFVRQSNGVLSADEISETQYHPFDLVTYDESMEMATWKNRSLREEGQNKDLIYETEDFVVPPQILKTDANRPRLVITIPFEDYNDGLELGNQFNQDGYVTFSGLLPRSMFMQDEGTSGQGQVPVRLDFLKEHVLTITTKMKPGDPELEFLPVTVEKWVNKGNYLPLANQAGIGNFSDFMDMIRYYQDKNDFQLGRYGFKDNISTQYSGLDSVIQGWHFQFRATNIVLPIDSIQGQMIPNADGTKYYVMDLRNRIQLIEMPDGTQRELPMVTISTVLYDILTSPKNDGVKAEKEGFQFSDLINSYNSNVYEMWKQCYFGEYNKNNGTWIFKISENIELDYLDIATMMLPGNRFGLKDFSFVFKEGITVKVKNVPENFLQNGESGEVSVTPEELYKIVAEEQNGIYSIDDFNNMILSQSIDNYAIDRKVPFWRDVTIEETAVQGKLHNEAEFSFSRQRKTIKINQYDGTSVTLTDNNISELVKIVKDLSPVTGLKTEDDFKSLIKAYSGYVDQDDITVTPDESLVSKYGYYYVNPKKWEFILSEDIAIDRELAGSMIPGNGKLDYIFNMGNYTVTIQNVNGEDEVPASSDDLVQFLSTPIEKPEPELPGGSTDTGDSGNQGETTEP